MRATLSAQCRTMILSVSSGGSLTAFVGQFIPINYVISVREERLVAIDTNILRISFENTETRMFTFSHLNFGARLKNMFSIKREVKSCHPPVEIQERLQFLQPDLTKITRHDRFRKYHPVCDVPDSNDPQQ